MGKRHRNQWYEPKQPCRYPPRWWSRSKATLYYPGMKPPAFPLMPLLPMSLMAAVVVSSVLVLRRLKVVEAKLVQMGASDAHA